MEAFFINTARGGVHQEADLIRALKKGEIWGAGLDVTCPEPMDKVYKFVYNLKS
ncbi:MAG: NAD(P)-dependent oxidoreductase [Desulfobacteraceae bacterium]